MITFNLTNLVLIIAVLFAMGAGSFLGSVTESSLFTAATVMIGVGLLAGVRLTLESVDLADESDQKTVTKTAREDVEEHP